MGERGGRERGSERGRWRLVAQILEVEARVGVSGRHVWEWETLHMRRNGCETKGRRGVLRRKSGRQKSSCRVVLVVEGLARSRSRNDVCGRDVWNKQS